MFILRKGNKVQWKYVIFFFLNFKTTHHIELPIGQTQAYKHVFGIPSWLFLVCSLKDSTQNKLKPVNFFSHVLDLKPPKKQTERRQEMSNTKNKFISLFIFQIDLVYFHWCWTDNLNKNNWNLLKFLFTICLNVIAKVNGKVRHFLGCVYFWCKELIGMGFLKPKSKPWKRKARNRKKKSIKTISIPVAVFHAFQWLIKTMVIFGNALFDYVWDESVSLFVKTLSQ